MAKSKKKLNASDLFALEWTDTLLDIRRLEAGTRQRVLSMLVVLRDELAQEIVSADLIGIPRSSERSKRMEQLIRDIDEIVNRRYATASKRLEMDLRPLASFANQQTVNIVNAVFTVDIIKSTLTLEELKSMVDEQVVLGAPAKDFWEQQASNLKFRFAQEVRKGVSLGENNDDIIKRVRGSTTGRKLVVELANGKSKIVPEYKGGIMDLSTQDAEKLVRTAVQSISNDVMRQVYMDNEDILRGYEAITTLDNKTSPICIARTGAAWDLKGEPLPESSRQEPFPGWPPWHFRCRTVLGPLTKTWAQLIEEATGKRLNILETVPDSVKVSMDGLLGKNVKTFDDFLNIKGDAWARNKLGAGRFELWKSGKITTSQLIDMSNHPLTIEQLLKLKPGQLAIDRESLN